MCHCVCIPHLHGEVSAGWKFSWQSLTNKSFSRRWDYFQPKVKKSLNLPIYYLQGRLKPTNQEVIVSCSYCKTLLASCIKGKHTYHLYVGIKASASRSKDYSKTSHLNNYWKIYYGDDSLPHNTILFWVICQVNSFFVLLKLIKSFSFISIVKAGRSWWC